MEKGEYVLVSRTNWECTLTLTIANDSGRSIHVSGIEAPFMGTQGGAEIVGRSSPDARIRDDGPDAKKFGEIDAIYDVDLDLAPRSRKSIDLDVRWRKEGCSGGTTTFGGWPTVKFSTVGRTFHRPAAQDLILEPNPLGQIAPGCKDRD